MHNKFSPLLTKEKFLPNLDLIKEHLEAKEQFIKY